MALTELEVARCRREVAAFVERRRPPPELRATVDLAYRIAGQSVEIFEVRARFREPGTTYESPIARATYVRTQNRWRVFWMRRDLKWHRYEPRPEVNTLSEFLGLVDRDEHACFFG